MYIPAQSNYWYTESTDHGRRNCYLRATHSQVCLFDGEQYGIVPAWHVTKTGQSEFELHVGLHLQWPPSQTEVLPVGQTLVLQSLFEEQPF